ncbi:flagellar basal body P-ring formation chaperone FlgA [Sphingomonas sp. ac-8]|uniref:flagellar basal body P-ring formation chaperone FlgA n=1 Tax=Sphingomonas sp. ac-8 TaxID=3242977 RepID=UPI003A80CF9E
MIGRLSLVALGLVTALPAAAQTGAAAVEVPVLSRAVARGQLLGQDDFASEPRTPAQARNALPVGDAVGKETTRLLPAGTVVRANDVIAPRLVRRGEPVTITIRSAGLAIATGGRALASAGAGEMVRVVNLSTNRTLDAVVEGPDAVRVTAP